MISELFASPLAPSWGAEEEGTGVSLGLLDLSQQTGSAKTYGGRILRNTSEIFSFGILRLVGQAGGEQDDRSTFAPHESRLVRRKSVFCKCVLGRVYTEHERLQAVLGEATAPLQSQGTFGFSAMVGYLQHLCNAGLPMVMLQCQGTRSIPAPPGFPAELRSNSWEAPTLVHAWGTPARASPTAIPLVTQSLTHPQQPTPVCSPINHGL